MVFGNLFRSSKDSKPPSSSRMPTGYYPPSNPHYMPPPSPVNHPHTSSSSKLHRRNAVNHHLSAGQYADRVVQVPWVRPGTAHRQSPPQDMSYGMPPADIPMPSSSSLSSPSSRKSQVSPPTLRRQDAFYLDNNGCPVTLSSMSGPEMSFTRAKTDRATSSHGYHSASVPHAPAHIPAHIPAYAYGPTPAPPSSRKPSKPRSSGHRRQTSTGSSSHASSGYPPSSNAYYPSSTNTSYTTPSYVTTTRAPSTRAPSSRPSSSRAQPSYQPPASHSHQRCSSRDSNGVSPIWASFPSEVQRMMGSDSGLAGVSRNVSQNSSRGVSRNTSWGSARAAAQYTLDNDTGCFRSDCNGGHHTHGSNALGIYPGYI